MGTLKKVSNVDYSASAVGKYDFETNIFRRKINGTLERNYLDLKQTKAIAYTPISLQSNIITLRLNYFDNYQSQNAILFSACDYTLRRSFYILIQTNQNKQTVMVWMGKETDFATNTSSAYQDSCSLGDVGYTNEHRLQITMDLNQLKVTDFLYNNERKAVARGANTIAVGRFTNGQTRTIAFGVDARSATDALSNGKPSFAQLSDGNGIFLHYDLLGDTPAEILTDKAQLITLKDDGAYITSRPIVL